jgi:hypothetical protein
LQTTKEEQEQEQEQETPEDKTHLSVHRRGGGGLVSDTTSTASCEIVANCGAFLIGFASEQN